MPSEPREFLPHVLLSAIARGERYTSPLSGGKSFSFKPKEKITHAQKLRMELARAIEEAQLAMQEATAVARSEDGLLLSVSGDFGFELLLGSLDRKKDGIELINVQWETSIDSTGQEVHRQKAVLFVPWGKLTRLTTLIEQYERGLTHTGKPKNQPLIESISEIKRATLKALWTDEGDLFPESDEEIWWEVWLRTGGANVQGTGILDSFRALGDGLGLRIQDRVLKFPERSVVLVVGKRSQLESSIPILNCIAELRRAKYTTEDFTSMDSREQMEWVNAAAARIIPPPVRAPAVCLLDTGVNSHPMLSPAIRDEDMASINPAWGLGDDWPHGTNMAGLSLHGDLVHLLLSNDPIRLTHHLESVKIFSRRGVNDPQLYGDTTKLAVAIAETTAPERLRVVCMAVAAKDERDRGRPSSWSSAVDQICFGAGEDDRVKRLMILAAGNAELHTWIHYPNHNATDGIHDPAQSWNALTVGAYTEKVTLDPIVHPTWRPLARSGGLSPCSTTALTWEKQWPFKPDIVMEGGNGAISNTGDSADALDSLQLLTTGSRPFTKLLEAFGDTSAATALASRFAAMLWSQYPGYWPETIRALIIHSASWTSTMLSGNDKWGLGRAEIERLLQIYGYGVPSLANAQSSARNSLTLISQESLHPFFKEKSIVKTRDWHIYKLPWPKQALQDLGETVVEMQVTLSYFIEPNPTDRGWRNKFRYASHGLRFEMKTPTDSVAEFRSRINKAVREEEQDHPPSDSSDWLLGPRKRVRGSVHSDWWQGTAADLAEKEYIAVYPVNGWWRERPQHGKWDEPARYSLIVTIRTPETGIDIYTPVANLILIS